MHLALIPLFVAAAVALRFGRAHRRRTLLEGVRERYSTLLGGDPGGRVRAELEREAGRIGRAIREVPDLDPSRLTFIDSTDPYPYLASGEIGVLHNFLAPREMVQREFAGLLEDALAHYRSEERRALHPLAWLGDVVFLPREVMDYLGLYTERTAGMITVLQLAYWLGGLSLAGLAVYSVVSSLI